MNKLYVYMFRSRNKDNKKLDNFKERSKFILEYEQNEEKIQKTFDNFVKEGIIGEKCRLYRSVNARNEEKIREELMIRLLKDKPSMAKLNAVLASVAQSVETKAENKWMFDFDVDDEALKDEFVKDIEDIFTIPNDSLETIMPIKVDIQTIKTPNGYAIVVPHGFDTRELMNKWKDYDITLKKDDMLFLKQSSLH